MLDLKKESPLEDDTDQKGVLIPSVYNGLEMKYNKLILIEACEEVK